MNKKTKRPKKIDLWDEGWGEENLDFNDWKDNGEELDEDDQEE
ncbi:MAG: hypothetical protein ACFFCD_08160 [Promethearchaeota archaeon]